MIVCKNCGTSNEAGATFCGSCGTFLEWSGETVESTPTPTPIPVNPVPPIPVPPIPVSPHPVPTTPTPGMVACPACGTENEPTRVYCRRCATELKPGPPVVPVPAAGPTTRPKVPVALLAAGAGLVVVAVVALVVLMPKSGPEADLTSAPDKPATSVPATAVPTASADGGQSTAPETLEPPLPPEPSGRIVFTQEKGGNANVVVWDAATGERTVLAGGGGDQSDPSWSPDGAMVVFRAAAGLTMINADGSPPEVPDFTHHGVDRHPAWSPDGELIAFVSSTTRGRFESSNSLDIYTRPLADNKELFRLTDDKADDWDPAWSPDGSRIAFVSKRDGPARLFLMQADGSRERVIDLGQGIFDDPDFSPDGEWIAFTRRDGKSAPKALYVARVDGSEMRRVTDVKAGEGDPAWSPDGKLIAVVRGTDEPVIAIVDVVTGEKVATISVDGAGALEPDWR